MPLPEIEMSPQMKKETTCRKSCAELLQEYGSLRPKQQEMNMLLDVHDSRISNALQKNDAVDIISTVRDKNCILKWRNQCMPDVYDQSQTRDRISREAEVLGISDVRVSGKKSSTPVKTAVTHLQPEVPKIKYYYNKPGVFIDDKKRKITRY